MKGVPGSEDYVDHIALLALGDYAGLGDTGAHLSIQDSVARAKDTSVETDEWFRGLLGRIALEAKPSGTIMANDPFWNIAIKAAAEFIAGLPPYFPEEMR